MTLLARLRCLRHGHDPSGERDAYGQPVRCARCDAYDGEMATWQWQRFMGIDAARRFAEAAGQVYAWSMYAAVMAGELPDQQRADRLVADLEHHMEPERYAEFRRNLAASDRDPATICRSF